MKRYLLTMMIALMACTASLAQKLSISSFEPLPNDISASTERRDDANNEACALLKVQLAQAGATFYGNVVGEVSYSQSEYRVYMTDGSKRLQIRLDGCLPLDIDFADHHVGPLKSLTTYKLVLVLPTLPNSIPSNRQSYKTCPDDNHPHMIDLGLPSGTKWACCNVGATKPEEYGGYYAWGETEVPADNYYDWSSYKHCDGSIEKCHNIGKDIANTQYDVAHVKMGGAWRMPTFDQIKELLDNCIAEWITRGGKCGIEVTGPKGKIFLPAAGFRWGSKLYSESYGGNYWSSSLETSHEGRARYLDFSSGGMVWKYYFLSSGGTVRAVCP